MKKENNVKTVNYTINSIEILNSDSREVIGNSIINLLRHYRKMLFKSLKKKELTAEQANIISRFNLQGYMTLEEIAKEKIEEIEAQINSKLQFNHREKLFALIVPEDQRDLYDLIKKHYDNKGFNTFYLDKDRIPEFKNSTYLFISWDITGEK